MKAYRDMAVASKGMEAKAGGMETKAGSAFLSRDFRLYQSARLFVILILTYVYTAAVVDPNATAGSQSLLLEA